MTRADDYARSIVNLVNALSPTLTVVNDVKTSDSIVEHVIDFDVNVQGEQFNVTINVIKM